MTGEESSYIDYEIFLSPSFRAAEFANSLVLATNNPTDIPLDLSTPLSKVLFDIQEINTNIDALTTKFAIPLLAHTREQQVSGERIARLIEGQVTHLNDGYQRLEREISARYETAEEIRIVAQRLWETARLGRAVGRCLQLGRQLEIQHGEITDPTGKRLGPKDDHVALPRCANTLLGLRALLASRDDGAEGRGLTRVEVIQTLQSAVISPAERSVLSKSQQIVREFCVPAASATTFFQATDMKARLTSALSSLYLLSPILKQPGTWEPEYLVNSLQEYLRAAHTSSLASLSRALTALPTLDRTLLEISARCQNILALESALSAAIPPPHPNLPSTIIAPKNYLEPLLARLETNTLPSWFWRTLASGLSTRVMELVNKGGVNLRVLRTNRNSIREAIRECVVKGVQVAGKNDTAASGKWEREVAVMVGSISGPLGK